MLKHRSWSGGLPPPVFPLEPLDVLREIILHALFHFTDVATAFFLVVQQGAFADPHKVDGCFVAAVLGFIFGFFLQDVNEPFMAQPEVLEFWEDRVEG